MYTQKDLSHLKMLLKKSLDYAVDSDNVSIEDLFVRQAQRLEKEIKRLEPIKKPKVKKKIKKRKKR